MRDDGQDVAEFAVMFAATLVLTSVGGLRPQRASNHGALCPREMAPGRFRIFNAKGRKLETSQTRYYVPERPTAGLGG
jgi:hypothetical protein